MAKVEVVSSEKENEKMSVFTIIMIIFLGFSFLASIVSIFSTLFELGESNNLKGCYITNDTLSEASLCFEGSKVKFSYWGSEVTLNVSTNDNEKYYITNEYDDYLFICNISKDNKNKIKCTSYNQALGTGNFYFEKE